MFQCFWGLFFERGAKLFSVLVTTRRGSAIGCSQVDIHKEPNDMLGRLATLFTKC